MYATHWGALLLAAVISFVVGWLWYGPVFGKKWMHLSGINPGQMDSAAKSMMMKSMVINFIGQVLTAYVFFSIASATYAAGFSALFSLALWILLGFQLPILAGEALWGKKSWGLVLLNACYQLAILIVSALVYSWMVA